MKHCIIELKNFGKEILGKIPNFELMKPIRNFMKKYAKLTPQVQFVDNFGFEIIDGII